MYFNSGVDTSVASEAKKPKLDKAFVSELNRRVIVNLVDNPTELTHGHNQPIDGGASRNYFNLSDPGSKPVTETLLSEGDEELDLITASELPTKCCDVRMHIS